MPEKRARRIACAHVSQADVGISLVTLSRRPR